MKQVLSALSVQLPLMTSNRMFDGVLDPAARQGIAVMRARRDRTRELSSLAAAGAKPKHG
jgi:hypothetical protein